MEGHEAWLCVPLPLTYMYPRSVDAKAKETLRTFKGQRRTHWWTALTWSPLGSVTATACLTRK